jgi:formylglycine-generating enzyme required for sulfatase activity
MGRSSESAVVNFLGRLLADRGGDGVRPLTDYLGHYPGHEAVITAEYERVTALAADAAESAPGQLGPYRLVRELGRGGQGAVWLAEDTRLSRNVALKVVPRSPLFDELSPRLEREARAASSLDHAGICAVYDVGADDAVSWIAMRYVEGETLAQHLTAVADGERDALDRVSVIEATARALHVAHEAGIVHRDVKPANVMLTPAGEPVVLDFGVARQDGAGPPLTLTGEVFGTPAYMSPEQLATDGTPVDRRADVWALGAMLYEVLTSRRPFQSPTREGLVRTILENEPTDLAQLPRDLAVVIETALCKEPDGRYQTALDLAEDLRRVRAHEPILARPAGPALRTARWMRRNPRLAASQAMLLVSLLVGLGVALYLLARTRDTLEEVSRLSDQKVADDLLAAELELWPADETRLAELETWLRDARATLSGRTVYETSHATALARIERGTPRETDTWLVSEIDQLLASLDRVAAQIPRVEARTGFARNVRHESVVARASEWDAAIRAVAEDPRYGGLALTPQLGLVPLGADSLSGLQEFAHLQSGAAPDRDPRTGILEHGATTGLIFVLIPGGESSVGCELPTPERPVGSPYVDPQATLWDHPRLTARLDPYFISKYEMTQAQWTRHVGANPSANQSGGWVYDQPNHPVEQITWDETERALRQLSLMLPTEAQWERAARGGTTTPWSSGEDKESLAGFANLADRHAQTVGGASWDYELWMDDGIVIHAPIGTFGPNPYGLHDVHGNVNEWCRDWWDRWYEDSVLRDGDGLYEPESKARIARGGHFAGPSLMSRSGARSGAAPDSRTGMLGVRPARALDP